MQGILKAKAIVLHPTPIRSNRYGLGTVIKSNPKAPVSIALNLVIARAAHRPLARAQHNLVATRPSQHHIACDRGLGQIHALILHKHKLRRTQIPITLPWRSDPDRFDILEGKIPAVLIPPDRVKTCCFIKGGEVILAISPKPNRVIPPAPVDRVSPIGIIDPVITA